MDAKTDIPAAPPEAPSPAAQETDSHGQLRHSALIWAERYALIAGWAILVLVFSLLRPHTYPTSANFQIIFGSQAVLLIAALGLLVPLTSGDFDLSIASTLSLSTMITAVLNAQHHWAIVPAMLIALMAALLVGTINGALVAIIGLDSFIVTLGMGTFLAGVVLWISHSNIISGISPVLSKWTITNTFLGISLDFWYGVAGAILLWYIMAFTPLGRRLLFVGRSRGVARLSGLPVRRIRWGALIASAGVAGLAGIVYAGQQGSADPTSGASFLLPAFAAAFLGATAISPGRFNAVGTFIAVYFLVSGITGLQQLGAQDFVQNLFYGAALIIAVALSHMARRRRTRGAEGDAGG